MPIFVSFTLFLISFSAAVFDEIAISIPTFSNNATFVLFETLEIMELRLPVKAIVGVIQRRKRIIIPNGTTQVMSGDNLIIFTTSENAPVIREFFEEIK